MDTAKKKLTTVIKWTFISLVSLFTAFVLLFTSLCVVTYFSNFINTESGIDESVFVSLGSQNQHLMIRGKDINNPVIIWLHGGPSSPDAFTNYTFQKYLVDEYTFVNWDQRGCGRTYFENKDTDPENKTATFDQAQKDLDELVDYVMERFSKDSVIIIGHSYGTILGSKYTLDNPDKVSAYIGVGQVLSIESETYSYEDALRIAKENNDDTSALEEAYKRYTEDTNIVNIMELRGHTAKYHTAPKSSNVIWEGIRSPHMTLNDLRWFIKQMGDLEEYVKLNQHLFDHILSCDVLSYGDEFQVPIGFISGSEDWVTPVKYSKDYYNAIKAPLKDIKLIDGCGHTPHYDDPLEFCNQLKTMLDNFL